MNLDMTFCASPNCENKCGRNIDEATQTAAMEGGRYLSFAYFCGEPTDEEKEGLAMNDELIKRAEAFIDDYKSERCVMPEQAADIIHDLLAENARLKARADMLDYIEHETLDLRCHNVPTGGDDYDVGWTVTRHHMDAPTERVIGQGFSVASAISAAQTPPKEQTR